MMKRQCMRVFVTMIVFSLAMSQWAFAQEEPPLEKENPYYYYEYQRNWQTIAEELSPDVYGGLYCEDERLHIIPTRPKEVQAYLDSLELTQMEKENIVIDDNPVLYSLTNFQIAHEKLKEVRWTYKIVGTRIDQKNNALIVIAHEEDFPANAVVEEIWRDDFAYISGIRNIQLMTSREDDEYRYNYKEVEMAGLTVSLNHKDLSKAIVGRNRECDIYQSGNDIFVPLRQLFYELNFSSQTRQKQSYTMEWDKDTMQITLHLNNREVLLDLYKNTMQDGRFTFPLYCPPAIKNGEVYISTRDICQIFKIRQDRYQHNPVTHEYFFLYTEQSPYGYAWECNDSIWFR